VCGLEEMCEVGVCGTGRLQGWEVVCVVCGVWCVKCQMLGMQCMQCRPVKAQGKEGFKCTQWCVCMDGTAKAGCGPWGVVVCVGARCVCSVVGLITFDRRTVHSTSIYTNVGAA